MTTALYQHTQKLATLRLLVDAGSFRAACARAKVSQSALSQTVTQLEAIFAQPLILRDSGSVRPTPACVALLDRIRPILLALDDLAHSFDNGATLPRLKSLDLGAYESLAISILPTLSRRLRHAFPDLVLTIRIGRSHELLRLVRKGDLCVAVTTEIDAGEGVLVIPLASDRLRLYIAAHHPWAGRGRAALGELGLGSLAPAREGHPGYYARYLRLLELPRPSVLSESFEALRALAAAGQVVAVLPERVAHRPDAPPLVELLLDQLVPEALGRHEIQLIAPKNCDEAERDYLTRELQLLFK